MFYLIIAAGFIKGDLFPALNPFTALPVQASDWAKLLVMAFLAGWAERLVPDALDRLVAQANAKSDGTGAAVAPVVPGTNPPASREGAPGSPAATSPEMQKLLDEFGPNRQPAEGADPSRGKFGGSASAGGWLLTAVAEKNAETPEIIAVTLKLTTAPGTPPPAAPPAGDAKFHLSPLFRKPVVSVPFTNGTAQLVLAAYHSFVVGAEFEGSGQRVTLELDLATIWPR